MSPLMPLTHAVDGLRRLISAGADDSVWAAAAVLALWGLVALAGTVLVAQHRRGRVLPALKPAFAV